MLVPFVVNQVIADEFKIPVHIIDWHRVRILKEIDDIRFMALRDGNLDLSLDALKAFKFHKLCQMANPVFNLDGTILSIDAISYAYDISKDEIIAAFNDFSNQLKVSHGVQWTLAKQKTYISQLVNGTGRMARLETCGFGQYAKVQASTAPLVYAWVSTASLLSVKSISADYLSNVYQQQSYLGSALSQAGTFFSSKPVTVTYYDSTGRASSISLSMNAKIYNSFVPRGRNISNSGIFIDATGAIPRLIQSSILLADIDANIGVNNDPIISMTYLKKSNIVSTLPDANVCLYEPNLYFEPLSTASKSYSMKTPSGGTYTLSVPDSSETFVQWYKKQKITLQNGKSYTYPYLQLTSTMPMRMGAIDPMYITSGYKLFYDLNKSQYSFPPYFPRLISTGEFQVRNGYLYADALTQFELEFFKFPDSTIDKLATVVSFQAGVETLKEDIKNGVIISQNENGVYKSYFIENGIKQPFLHPVTLKEITSTQYMNEMIFESLTVWAEAKKEIDAFIEPMRIKNDYNFQKAYEAYLRGEATLKGPEAIALFEKKLLTGIFYSENGFQYWRAFTLLELKLIEKMKSNSLLSKEQADINVNIIAQNAIYQEQANASILKENEDKVAIAKIMAEAELKVMADNDLAKMVAPTIGYLVSRAEIEGGVPTDILQKWVNENPYYYLRDDTKLAVEKLLTQLTQIEQGVTTALVADIVAEVEMTKALKELFNFK